MLLLSVWAAACTPAPQHPVTIPAVAARELRPVVTMDDFAETMTEEGAAIHARNEQRLAGE